MQKLNKLNRFYEASNGDFAVSLFPYQIKDVNNFYDRDHPKDISSNSLEYNIYWNQRIKNYIEGRWVDDNGTWVYMYPKLDFYINYTLISDENRDSILPRMRDLEWIQLTYYTIGDGFSGFEDDKLYTCNQLIRKIEAGETLNDFEKGKLEKYKEYLLAEDGVSYKQYVDPWDYLTEHYLITYNQNKPLGRALFHNTKSNIMILAARACAKSYICYMGDFLHEFLFDGARTVEDFYNTKPKNLLFAMGSKKSDQIQKSIDNVSRFYNNMPGSYVFGVTDNGKQDKVWGALYKSIIGTWSVAGSQVEHNILNRDNTVNTKANKVFFHALTPDAYNVCAGDRYRRLYVEEVGFISYINRIHAANKNSLGVGQNKDGMAVYLGTGGDMESIVESKNMFDNPKAYDIVQIPNYFERELEGKIAMFIPVYYQDESLKDKNGNTRIEDALAFVIEKRIQDKVVLDSASFAEGISYNPLYPKEMLRPSSYNELPVVELAEHLSDLLTPRGMDKEGQQTNIYKQKRTVGSFEYNTAYTNTGGVQFKPDIGKNLTPIMEWGRDSALKNREGAWIMYEDVIEDRPNGLYYLALDPYGSDGADGPSMQAAYMYKHYFTGGSQKNSLQDTIVAAFVGRKDRINKSYDEVLKAAHYYNAKIVPEMINLGFYTYVEQLGLLHMLQSEPWKILQDKARGGRKGSSNSYYKVGIRPDKYINDWSLKQLAQWLLKPVIVDPLTNRALKYNYQNIYDVRLLSELINYEHDKKTKFDAVSAVMLLMPILADIEETPTVIPEETHSNENIDRKYHTTYTDHRPRVTTPKIMQF